jgi:hypothetical protein
MKKQPIIDQIREKILEEAETLTKAAKAAHANATAEESKAECKYDTRGLEAGYLAQGQARLAAEAMQDASLYHTLPLKDFSPTDPIALSALLELECDGKRAWYFMGPKKGGITLVHEGNPLLLITPTSPLGQMLLGKKQGDHFEMTVGNTMRDYSIISVC